MKRIKRNEKCVCGSGKKFKHCCIESYNATRNNIITKTMELNVMRGNMKRKLKLIDNE